MPAKKKERMTEEERLRALQLKLEAELEAKRRKQQLIAAFSKNKLKREEAFSRLNTAKINEQWRFVLRKIKCKELYEDLDYLWKHFEKTVKAKDAIIRALYEELEIADLDHRRLQEAHIEIVDTLIGRQKRRLRSMYKAYRSSVREIEIGDISELHNLHGQFGSDCKHLETVIFAQTDYIDEKWNKTKTRNSINTRAVKHSSEKDISYIHQLVGGQIQNLWKQLENVIVVYESSTKEKRKQYEYLKEQDDAMRSETAQFPKIQSQLQSTIEILKDNQQKLETERYGRITELKNQAERLNQRIWKLRQEIRMNQTVDTIQLKRSSVMSGSVIKDLKRIEEKGSALLLLIKMCSGLEPTALAVKKYAIHCTESAEETDANCVTSPYDKLEKFWEQYNHVKAENIHRKRERDQLVTENKRLRHTLRTYLITVARIPASRPHTSN